MRNPHFLFRFVLAAMALLAAPALIAAGPAKAGKSSAAPKAQATLREIEYPDLENKIGQKLVVYTTNNTTRSGTLVRYTNVTLTLQLGPEAGSIELAVPRKGVRKVMIEIGPADPLFLNEGKLQEGESGAKTN
ncbi:hypothetical protein [Dokdonella immobilis]|uniref:Uncharacterized protein n=1 Tax=Dokdonella immobilis TaxID=578942 RepID=A0A1I4XR29_9GAMM|nr:hypothetical protein [Dokdonella immobilis]SFN28294.1 hypothetical protein SAMN05216289_11168 [Dokdonella immobilis]